MIVTRLAEHDDVIKSLLRGAPRPGLASGPAPAGASPVHDATRPERYMWTKVDTVCNAKWSQQSFCIWWQNLHYHLANLWNWITTISFYIFVKITLKQQKFSQCDSVLIRQFWKKLQSNPVLIRPKLASVLIQSDPILVRSHLCYTAEMITIRFAGCISSRIVSLQPDKDIQKLLSKSNRIRIRVSETLLSIFRGFRFLEKVAHCTIIYLLSSEASFQPSASWLWVCLLSMV